MRAKDVFPYELRNHVSFVSVNSQDSKVEKVEDECLESLECLLAEFDGLGRCEYWMFFVFSKTVH